MVFSRECLLNINGLPLLSAELTKFMTSHISIFANFPSVSDFRLPFEVVLLLELLN